MNPHEAELTQCHVTPAGSFSSYPSLTANLAYALATQVAQAVAQHQCPRQHARLAIAPKPSPRLSHSAWTYMRVLALLTCILGVAATVLVLGCALRSEAGASVLSLFFFQARAVQLSVACALRDFESRRNGT